jgi:hypothetical protein
MRLVRGDLAGSGLVLGVTAATVLAWLTRAAPQAEASNDPRLQPLPGTQGHRDEMGHFIARQHARATDEAGASLPAGQDGRPWSWVSGAPECRWRIAAGVGPRTRETAKEGVAAPQARGAGIFLGSVF